MRHPVYSRTLLALLAATFFNAACASNVPSIDTGDLPKVSADSLGEGDIVEIKVFREPELAGVYRVGNAGNIDFPLIGQVSLIDRKTDAVASEIRERLAEGYLKNPQVTVFVREYKSRKVHVLGQVNKAGTFPHEQGMTIITAITMAGDFSKLAATNSVRVTRRVDGSDRIFNVPVGDIRKGEATNFDLIPGDIVFVPEALF